MQKVIPNVRPFLKWAGNKYRVIPQIQQLLPAGTRLIEPFAGSGAVFLNTDYPRYLLTDSNADLIHLYQILQASGPEFIAKCAKLFRPLTNQAEYFYRRRTEFNSCSDPVRKAALFVYLNRHGYNGLCRYNARGIFNVPFGRYKAPYFPAREMLAFHAKAARATFEHIHFEHIIERAQPGDVIYCDPPYVPLSKSANFTQYSSNCFDLTQQQRLAELATSAGKRGIPVLISNHNTRFTRDAYRDAHHIKRFDVQRSISCRGTHRQPAAELLALYLGSDQETMSLP